MRATQFFEFVKRIAHAATTDNTVRLSPALIQPIAADDVASAVARIAAGPPINGTVELAGPQEFRLDELVRLGLGVKGDERVVISDPEAPYFGAVLQERTLLPGDGAVLSSTRFEDWISKVVPW